MEEVHAGDFDKTSSHCGQRSLDHTSNPLYIILGM